jgi:hypothetical protein
VTLRNRRGLDLDDDNAAMREQFRGPLQGPDRVPADTDIPVGEQNLFPAALGGQCSE